MARIPKNLNKQLSQREEEDALRTLGKQETLVDFYSNDYLGMAANEEIFLETNKFLKEKKLWRNGATGSRLLSGNYPLYSEIEKDLASFYRAEASLVFDSGYAANTGLFSSLPGRNDCVFYDELIHASIRDGIRMSPARSFKFSHNSLDDLNLKINRYLQAQPGGRRGDLYIATESVFSMDGDTPDLISLAGFSKENDCHLIVDEAHAVGIFGTAGEGLVGELGLENEVFARIATFGKAFGCHGAAILGSPVLKTYLVNFARSFIYSTGLPPHSLATLVQAHRYMATPEAREQKRRLMENSIFFDAVVKENGLEKFFLGGGAVIKSCIIPGTTRVKRTAAVLQRKGFGVKPILSPTVPEGKERLRFCLHSYNTKEEITEVLAILAEAIVN